MKRQVFDVARFIRPKRRVRRALQALVALIVVFAGLLFAVVTIIQARAPGLVPWLTPQAVSGVSRVLTPIVSFYPQMEEISSVAPALDQRGASLVVYSPSGAALTVGTPFGLAICSMEARTVRLEDFIDIGSPVTALAYAPDGNMLASGSYTDTIQIWDIRATARLSRSFGDKQDAVNSLAYSPDGTLLVSGSADGAVRLWRVADGSLLRMLKGHLGAVRSVAFSPDGSLVASGGVDGSVHMWQVDGDFSTSSVFDNSGGVPTVSFSNDGSLLAFGSGDGLVRLLDAKTGKLVQTWSGHGSVVTALGFSPDSTVLASGSYDGSILVRSVADGKVLAMLNNSNGVASLTFNPDGSMLAAGGIDGAVEMWAVSAITAPVVVPTPAAIRVPVVVPTQPAVAPVSVALGCTDIAAFVGDVTIPDNTLVAPGVLLNKTWRFRNVGTCTWGAGYRLAFVEGNALGAQPQQSIALTPPGGIVDVTAAMVAPTTVGAYRGSWQLINAAGTAFGPRATIVIQVAAPVMPVLLPAPVLGIAANSTNINAGDSVTIQASVQNVQAAWVNGQPVVNNFFQQTVQLCNSTTFVLTALLPDGAQTSQSVTVNVHGLCGGERYLAEPLKRAVAPVRSLDLGEPLRALPDRLMRRGFVGLWVNPDSRSGVNRDWEGRPRAMR